MEAIFKEVLPVLHIRQLTEAIKLILSNLKLLFYRLHILLKTKISLNLTDSNDSMLSFLFNLLLSLEMSVFFLIYQNN